MRLTDKTVPGLALPAGKSEQIVFDDKLPGFGVRIREGAARAVWVYQYRAGRQQRRVKLGVVGAMAAAKARATAEDLAAKVHLGADPQGEKASARLRTQQTFKATADSFLAYQERALRPATLAATSRYLLAHARPLHAVELREVSRTDIAAQLTRIAREHGPVAANRARSAWSAMFGWAMSEGLTDANPTVATNLRAETPRDRVLTNDEIYAIWRALQSDDYSDIIRMLLLTGQRRGEVGDLRWDEIDLDRASATLPAGRTKNNRPHEVPLSAPVLDILRARHHHRDFVFGTYGAGGFNGWAKARQRLDATIAPGAILQAWTVHDLRRTAATGMADIGVEPPVVEAVLNHQSGARRGVAGTYNRSRYAPQKRQALDMWAAHLLAVVEGKESNVTPLRSA
jgi:integrase